MNEITTHELHNYIKQFFDEIGTLNTMIAISKINEICDYMNELEMAVNDLTIWHLLTLITMFNDDN